VRYRYRPGKVKFACRIVPCMLVSSRILRVKEFCERLALIRMPVHPDIPSGLCPLREKWRVWCIYPTERFICIITTTIDLGSYHWLSHQRLLTLCVELRRNGSIEDHMKTCNLAGAPVPGCLERFPIGHRSHIILYSRSSTASAYANRLNLLLRPI